MLTPEHAFLQQDLYRANEKTRDALRDTELIAFVGGIAVGKSVLMDHVSEASGFPICGTETTRSPKPSDNPAKYRYSTTAEMLAAIERYELVQYGVSLPHAIYGSRLEDYERGRINVTDIWYEAIKGFDNKGFKSVKTVSVLTRKQQWLSQLATSTDGMSTDKVEARIREAKHSMKWSIVQHISHVANHLVIINDVDRTAENVQKVIDFSEGRTVEPHSEDEVFEVAKGMGEAVETMYTRLGSSEVA